MVALLTPLSLLVLLWLISQGVAYDPSNAPGLVGLVAAQIVLEGLAIPQAGFGFFSASFSCAIGSLVLYGPAPAALGLLAGLLLRSLLQSKKTSLSELLADGCPVAFSLAIGAFFGQPAMGETHWLKTLAFVACSYLPFSIVIPERLARAQAGFNLEKWQAIREITGRSHLLAVAFAGAALAFLMTNQLGLGLLVAPILFSLHRASRTEQLRLQNFNMEELLQEVARSRSDLFVTKRTLDSTRYALQNQINQRAFFEQLVVRLLAAPNREQVLESLAGSLEASLRASSLVFFGADNGGKLSPLWIRSPWSDRIRSSPLLGLQESIVEQAWRSNSLQSSQSQQETRLSPEELSAIAVPVAREGILYIGRLARGGFGPQEVEILLQVAGLTALAFQSAQRFSEQAQALSLFQQSTRDLQIWVNGLSLLLEGARALLTPQQWEVRMDRFYQLLDLLFPSEACAILHDGQIRLRGGQDWDEAALRELANPLLRFGKALLVEDLQTMKVRPPLPEARSLLAVPLGDEEGTYGAIWLFSRQIGVFTTFHRDLLALLGCLLLASRRSADLAQQVEHTQSKLLLTRNQSALGRISGSISHLVNSPLGAVTLQLSLALRRKETPEEIKNYLRDAKEAAERARSVIAKQLYYSEDSVGEWRRLDLAEVVRDTGELTQHDWQSSEVELDLRLPDPLMMSGCPHELQQAVMSLLDNARRSSLQSQARKVEVRGYADAGKVLLEFIDSGPPLDPEIRSQMFTPFFSSWNSTGLGLSSARTVAHRHGGDIEAQSDRKCFRLTLSCSPRQG